MRHRERLHEEDVEGLTTCDTEEFSLEKITNDMDVGDVMVFMSCPYWMLPDAHKAAYEFEEEFIKSLDGRPAFGRHLRGPYVYRCD